MSTVLEAYDDVHAIIVRKKLEIREKYGKKIDMVDITSAAIKRGIDKVDDELGLKKVEQNLKLVEV